MTVPSVAGVERNIDDVANRVDEAVSRARADLLRTSTTESGLSVAPPAQAQGL